MIYDHIIVQSDLVDLKKIHVPNLKRKSKPSHPKPSIETYPQEEEAT